MTTDVLKPISDLPSIPETFDPDVDTYALLREFQSKTPLVRTEFGFTLALKNRHMELVTSDATRQIETESKMIQGITDGPIFEFTRLAMLFANGDLHKNRRTPVARTFAFKLMDAMRPKIRELAEELVSERIGKGPIDFLEEIASQLPARIIASILGIPDDEVPVFRRWIQDSATSIGIIDVNDRDRIEQSLSEFMDYVGSLLDDRRKNPREDFLTDYVRTTAEAGNLSEAEIRTQCLGLILAGSDTTRASICMILSELLQRPDQWGDFVADPDGLKRAAVEEGLRFQPVISAVPRITLRDIEVDGYLIPEGSVFAISVVAALRDPDVFEDPDTFNIHRTDQQRWHYVFGAGAHRCVGEALARAEMEETLAVIARLAPNTKLVGDPPKYGSGAIRPIDQMQVAFEA
ncbi:MAG: cytochrome P450 [Pseudomonadota bacterium]